MIVVDISICPVISPKRQKLLERDDNWNALILWRSEYRNILAGYMRRGTLPFENAYAIQLEAEG